MALTLIELLCVVAIISLLVGLLLPAVQRVREAGNRLRCLSHLKQIGLACHSFHDAHDHLPPSRWDCLAGTWMNALLPYVEQANGARLWRADRTYHYQPEGARTLKVSVYRCPSRADRGLSRSGDGRGPVPHRPGMTGDYAVVIGDAQPGALDHPPPQARALGTVPGNGPWLHAYGPPCPGHLWVSFASLTRGLSHTLLIGEKSIGPPPSWGHPPDNCIYNADHAETVGRHVPAGFAGPHAATLFAFADGSATPLTRPLPAQATRD